MHQTEINITYYNTIKNKSTVGVFLHARIIQNKAEILSATL